MPITLRSLYQAKGALPLEATAHAVYSVTCKTCSAEYIGETQGALCVRGNEHRDAVCLWHCSKSAVAQHVHNYEVPHEVDWNNLKVVNKSKKLCEVQSSRGIPYLPAPTTDEQGWRCGKKRNVERHSLGVQSDRAVTWDRFVAQKNYVYEWMCAKCWIGIILPLVCVSLLIKGHFFCTLVVISVNWRSREQARRNVWNKKLWPVSRNCLCEEEIYPARWRRMWKSEQRKWFWRAWGCSLRTYGTDNKSGIVDNSLFYMITVNKPNKGKTEEKRKGSICEGGKKAVCDGRRFLLHILIGFSFNSIFNGFVSLRHTLYLFISYTHIADVSQSVFHHAGRPSAHTDFSNLML